MTDVSCDDLLCTGRQLSSLNSYCIFEQNENDKQGNAVRYVNIGIEFSEDGIVNKTSFLKIHTLSKTCSTGVFTIHEGHGFICGSCRIDNVNDLENDTFHIYSEMLKMIGGRHLARIWNCIPQINSICSKGENYHLFNTGRMRAFANSSTNVLQLPAATAVGTNGSSLSLAFLVVDTLPTYHENPRQTPAYRYPPSYGINPPFFSRATTTVLGGEKYIFISGTSSVVSSETLHPNDLKLQVKETLKNFSTLFQTMGTEDLFFNKQQNSTCVVYLRCPNSYQTLFNEIVGTYLSHSGKLFCLSADICRSDLQVEIEITYVDKGKENIAES